MGRLLFIALVSIFIAFQTEADVIKTPSSAIEIAIAELDQRIEYGERHDRRDWVLKVLLHSGIDKLLNLINDAENLDRETENRANQSIEEALMIINSLDQYIEDNIV